MSSIAGIGFGLSQEDGTGYYLEVESLGGGKDLVSAKALSNNLRLYRVEKKTGTLQPNILLLGHVNAYTTVTQNTNILVDQYNNADPVFDLKIIIKEGAKHTRIDVYYGETKVNNEPIIFKNNDGVNQNSKKICFFVRNDSQAIYEYVAAASALDGEDEEAENYFADSNKVDLVDRQILNATRGIVSPNAQNLIKNKNGKLKVYYNDFARIVRQAKKYVAKYDNPAIKSKIIDISNVNPQYMVKEISTSPYTKELLVTNTSAGAIALSEQNDLPLYIFGIKLQELSTGEVTADSLFDKDINDQKRVSNFFYNKTLYGDQSFSLDSRFIQSSDRAKALFNWIVKNCSRQRLSFSLEIFPNPLLELGDKIKIVAKDRGYFSTNQYFGDKTFVISQIGYNVSDSGPTQNVTIIEVGEE
jgi:hypothetical protein